MWVVGIWEYESGWSKRLDEVRQFSTEREALKFQDMFNNENDAVTVPEWYMIATAPTYEGEE